MNGQMETGNDLFTALNSVNDIEKNADKFGMQVQEKYEDI